MMSMCILLVLLINVVSVQVCSFEPVVLISTQVFWAAHLTRQGCETLGDEPAGQYGEEQHTTPYFTTLQMTEGCMGPRN